MSGIVYQTDKRYGTTYAYRVGYEVDPDSGGRKRTREYLGRVDPGTGEIVPKATGGGRNRASLGGDGPGEGAGLAELRRALDERDREVARLRAEVVRLSGVNRELEERNGVLLDAYVAAAGLVDGLRDQASEWLAGS